MYSISRFTILVLVLALNACQSKVNNLNAEQDPIDKNSDEARKKGPRTRSAPTGGENSGFCASCGAEIGENMIFCPICGEKMDR